MTTKTNGLNGNMPWWAKFISAVGVPSAALLFLIYWLTTSHAAALEQHSHAQEHDMEVLTTIMQQVCVNTADTPEEQAGCFRRVGP